MNILEDMIQGSPEWMAVRAQRFTASEAAAVMGDHKYMTRNELLKQKATGIVPEVDAAKQALFNKGHQAEAAARQYAEEIIGEELYPCTCEDDSQTYLASMDGLAMISNVGWEHKLLSTQLKSRVESGDLEEHYKWQMDHQMMVSGADSILFMTSDGTPENSASIWYERDEDRIKRLIAGWEQFAKDLASFEAPESAPAKAVGAPIAELPSIRYELNGLALKSNIDEYRKAAEQLVEESKKPLETDQDFADAEIMIKAFKDAESKIAHVQDQVIGEIVDIDLFRRDLGGIGELIRQARLNREKQVKSEKERRKTDIHSAALNKVRSYYDQINASLDGVTMPVPADIGPTIGNAMKGKKTVETLQSAADDAVAAAKIDASQLADKVRYNLVTLGELAADHRFLFNDLQQIVTKDAEDFTALVKSRIADHKAQEQKRLDAERERIRQEEAQKAEQASKAAADQRQSAPPESTDTTVKKPEAETVRSNLEVDISCFLFDHTGIHQEAARHIAHLIATDQIPGVQISARRTAAA